MTSDRPCSYSRDEPYTCDKATYTEPLSAGGYGLESYLRHWAEEPGELVPPTVRLTFLDVSCVGDEPL